MPPTVRRELRTRFAETVDPESPWPEYPRPQLRRDRWQTLNGPWELAIVEDDADEPAAYPLRIRVPFPIESALGGVQARVEPGDRAWYRRRFRAPDRAPAERLLLHFGGVDWSCEVFVDGARVGSHVGGHVPFCFDVTEALGDGPEHVLVVAVRDPTDAGPQPVGKQSLDPKLIQYTAVTGIWQTVWLEPVPATRVRQVRATSCLAREQVHLEVAVEGDAAGSPLEVEARVGEVRARGPAGARLTLELPGLRAWSPDDPFLYDVRVRLLRDGNPIDVAESYFGAREIGTARDAAGHWRITLNGDPFFPLGPLDQGWWPDGLYTAPTDEALAFDVEATRRMGFNCIRKHVKIEPARWYWHADRLGVLVWQDMPSPPYDQSAFIRRVLKEKIRPQDADYALTISEAGAAAYRDELDAMLDALAPFPCIGVWVPFNEAWGQHDTRAVIDAVAAKDPSRLVDGPSGWKDAGEGAIRDHHLYNEEADFPGADPQRPTAYGEFGGLGLRVESHVAVDRGWGYQDFDGPDALEERYRELYATLEALVDRGLAGAIYTQTTDVESELNGLLTYDRAVFKIDPETLAGIHARLLARSSVTMGGPDQETR